MKNTLKARFAPAHFMRAIGIAAVVAVIGFSLLSLTGCSDGGTTAQDQTPTAADFNIGSLSQALESFTGLTITAKSGKSGGAIIIYYNELTTLPTAAGSYTVTFDVAATTGWNAASGLSAGTLTLYEPGQEPTPVASDFTIGSLSQIVGSVSAVTITPKSGKSGGAITIYYNGSTTLPTAAGSYTVTFDVAAAAGWNAASGLSAGTLTIDTTGGIITADFTGSVAEFVVWLPKQSANTASQPYNANLIITNTNDFTPLNTVLNNNLDKFVYLDLSGSTITAIPIGAFWTRTTSYIMYGCITLTGITIPNSVTRIREKAFGGCTGLTSVTIPNSVTQIDGEAFQRCTGLTSITIPNSVTSWIDGFSDCTGLTNVTIGNGVIGINVDAFRGCTSLANVTIGNSVTYIGYGAFKNCTSLTSITIPNSVTGIGGEAFQGCTSLISIIIPNSVTSYIGERTFEDCTSLTNVIIGNGVTGIANSAFSDCTGLTSITIGNSVDWIKNSIFSGCTSLTSITIPSSVTQIGSYAFDGCTNLASVTFEGTIDTDDFNSYQGYGFTNLRSKYLSATGGIGTYTTTAPVGPSSTWTKQ